MREMYISIEELRQSVRLGWSETERAFPQIVTMNLRLEIPGEKASDTDDLADTVDYTRVINAIENLCAENSWRLLERMVSDIAAELLACFSLVQAVEISVRKNISTAAQGISVSYSVARADLEEARPRKEWL